MGNVTSEKLQSWAEDNKVKNMRKAIDHDPSHAHTRYPEFYNTSLLHMAAKAGALETVQLLLDSGVEVDLEDERGTTPLHSACRWQQGQALEVVDLLLKNGASLDTRWGPDGVNALLTCYVYSGMIEDTPQERASLDVSEALIRRVLEEYESRGSANVNLVSKTTGSTPLDWVVSAQRMGIFSCEYLREWTEKIRGILADAGCILEKEL